MKLFDHLHLQIYNVPMAGVPGETKTMNLQFVPTNLIFSLQFSGSSKEISKWQNL